MITLIIERVIRYKWAVLTMAAALAALSVYSLRTAALDAIPDISDPQVIVYTKWARSPQVIETEVTEPVIRALQGSPDIRALRGTSHMGFSFVYVILSDPGRRAIVRVDVDRVSDSCGFAVPRMNLEGERQQLVKWARRKGEAGLDEYRRNRNARSIDGLPALEGTGHET